MLDFSLEALRSRSRHWQLSMLKPNRAPGVLALSCQTAVRSCQVYEEEPERDGGDAAAGSSTATGFAAKEALAVLRKHSIATASLLLRAGLSDHGLAPAADEIGGVAHRNSSTPTPTRISGRSAGTGRRKSSSLSRATSPTSSATPRAARRVSPRSADAMAEPWIVTPGRAQKTPELSLRGCQF